MPSVTVGHVPDLERCLKSLKGQSLDAATDNLISLLKRRQIKGAEPCAVATAHILLQVVAKSRWHDVDSLLNNVTRTGRRLVAAQPNEFVIANIVRRVLGLIRDEAAEERNEAPSEGVSEDLVSPVDASPWPVSTVTKQDSLGDYIDANPPIRPGLVTAASSLSSSINVPKSLFHLLSASPSGESDMALKSSPFGTSGTTTPLLRGPANSQQVHALRSEIIDGIEEIKDEISQVDDQIAALAEVQVQPGHHILVHRPSPTVERFVLRAASRRKFTVFIVTDVQRKPTDDLQYAGFRKKLSAAGITVINVMSSGMMAYMSRVNKVILGAKAIMADGGVVSDSGAAAIARAANLSGTAVVVLGGIYKLSPENLTDEAEAIEWGDPSSYVSFADGPLVEGVEVRTALTELVPTNFIDTYITNLGTHSQDHLSGLIADHYKFQDVDFHLGNEVE